MTGLLLNSIEQSTGKYKPEAVLSAYYHDAFFIDLITTNGVCHSDCRFGERFPKPKVSMHTMPWSGMSPLTPSASSILAHNSLALWSQLSWALLQVLSCRHEWQPSHSTSLPVWPNRPYGSEPSRAFPGPGPYQYVC